MTKKNQAIEPDAWICKESDPIDNKAHTALKSNQSVFVSSAYDKQEPLFSQSKITEHHKGIVKRLHGVMRMINDGERDFALDEIDSIINEELEEVFNTDE